MTTTGWGGARSHDNQQTQKFTLRRGERFVLETTPGQYIGVTVTETRRQVVVITTDLGQVMTLRRGLDIDTLMERADAVTSGGRNDPAES